MANVWNGSLFGGSQYRTWAGSEANIAYTTWDAITAASTARGATMDLNITWHLFDMGKAFNLCAEIGYNTDLLINTVAGIEFDVQLPIIPAPSFSYQILTSTVSATRFISGFNSIGVVTGGSSVTITHFCPPIGQHGGSSQTFVAASVYGPIDLSMFGRKT